MGTRTVDGTDVGFLVDFPCNRATHLFLFVVIVVRVFAVGDRFMGIGPHQQSGDEITRLRREVEDLREQLKNQQAAR